MGVGRENSVQVLGVQVLGKKIVCKYWEERNSGSWERNGWPMPPLKKSCVPTPFQVRH